MTRAIDPVTDELCTCDIDRDCNAEECDCCCDECLDKTFFQFEIPEDERTMFHTQWEIRYLFAARVNGLTWAKKPKADPFWYNTHTFWHETPNYRHHLDHKERMYG